MSKSYEYFNLRKHCHVNTNEEGDRFVGVKADSNNAIVYFPAGYELPNSDVELRKDIYNLLRVLTIFVDKSDDQLHKDNFTKSQLVKFPIQAYFNVINWYLDHNGKYYSETNEILKVRTYGRKDWNRTIKTQKPMIQGQSPIYLNMVVRHTTPNYNRLITKIHKYCVYDAFKKIGWLYTTGKPEEPDIIFDKTLFLSTLYSKYANTNMDKEKELFKSMIAMIEFIDNYTIDKQFYYGTDNFETVWEKLINRFFSVKNKEKYFPRAYWIEKYRPNNEADQYSSTLVPDSIMEYNKKLYILDAKYYRYGVYPNLGLSALPRSADINKQITYGQYAYEKYGSNYENVFNAFIMPFNKYDNKFQTDNEFINVAEAGGYWIAKPNSYERVQGILADTRYVLKNYDGNHDLDKEKLSIEIEKVLKD